MPSPVPEPGEALSPGAGVTVVPPPVPASPEPAPSVDGAGSGAADDEERGEPVDGVVAGSRFCEPDVWPLKASPTVVLVPPPLKLWPETASYVVIPAIVTPKTRAVATSGLLQLLTRAR